MFQPEKLGRHNQAFMIVLGVLSALLNAGVYVSLADGFGVEAGSAAAPLTLGLSAFFAFYAFQLMISARHMTWMLGQGFLRWLRILLVCMLLFMFVLYEDVSQEALREMLLEWVLIVAPAQLLLLALLRMMALRVNNAPGSQRRAIFVGLGSEAQKLAHRLQRSPILGIHIIGYYADQPIEYDSQGKKLNLQYLGTYADAATKISGEYFSIAFVTMEDKGEMAELMETLYDTTGSIYFMPEPHLSEGFSVHGAEIAGVPLLALHESQMLGLPLYLKRTIDVVLASAALVILSPIMLAAAIAVKLDSPGPILFRQKRYGERGMPIVIYKFRSMRTDPVGQRDEKGVLRQAQQGDARVTRVGRFLRRSSIDELPQLFNVLEGTMSLVGPRPHAASHNEFYRHQIRGYMLRHSVKPGITGWAQVNGLRGETDTLEKMQRRVEYDRYYITHWSVWLDIQIMFKTVWRIVWDRNAY